MFQDLHVGIVCYVAIDKSRVTQVFSVQKQAKPLQLNRNEFLVLYPFLSAHLLY